MWFYIILYAEDEHFNKSLLKNKLHHSLGFTHHTKYLYAIYDSTYPSFKYQSYTYTFISVCTVHPIYYLSNTSKEIQIKWI